MKKILGLDLGTNSIGWSLIEQNFAKKEGKIIGLGSRIIPMSQDVLGKFDSGVSISQTAERTGYRGVRRLNQRNLLRRERLHRVLNILEFLPKHYSEAIDFEKHFGQFKENVEVKLNYSKNEQGRFEFLFIDSFNEMVAEFKDAQPQLFYKKENGKETKISYDWTLYYLRKKALSKKISKEELAWVILNFNQKRGYYQLREEESEASGAKQEEFYTLKVADVQATDDKNEKGTWYNVILENDWIYRRQSKEPLNNWIGKYKEFIITTTLEKDGSLKLDKEGNVKRSFRAVDSEKDWIAIKKKTEQDIDKSKKTVGQYIYETLLRNPKQKIRGRLVKTIERKFYKEEFAAIIKEQVKHHSELQDSVIYENCIQELYPRNEAHQQNISAKGFEYLFVEDIIFYQRPLKSKKSTISNCSYEKRCFKKKVEIEGIEKEIVVREALKGISKSHPLFQEFRLWQFLKNLKIYRIDGKADIDITLQLLQTEEDWVGVFDFLNAKKEVEQKQIIQYFISKKLISKAEKSNYRWNYVEDKKYPCNETRASFLSQLSKVQGIEATSFLTSEKEHKLWHIIYSVKDKREFETAIENFAIRNNIDKDTFMKNFGKIPPFKNDYGAYSEKAIKKLLPLMRKGKHWSETAIAQEVKDRIESIMERVATIDVKAKDINEEIARVSDDDIPKQLVKSFLKTKDKSLSGLNTYQACYAVYGRHSEASEIKQWQTTEDINEFLKAFKQHSLRNPIVEQVVTETLRVVRDIWNYYGDGTESFFDEIHVELGREMKNDKKTRERISKQNTTNENTNHRIKELLKELMNDSNIEGDIRPYSYSHQEILKIYEEGIYQNIENVGDDIEKIRKSSSPTKSEINKYKLWLEQGYISPYTGEPIPMSRLFTVDYQIEHIIPQSRYFDDSLSNKVICESAINPNPYKDNQTGYEFIKNQGGSIVSELSTKEKTVKIFTLEQYESHCNKYFKKNRTKLRKLLSEEIPEGFIERQLNDSRYISKLIKGLLSNIVREDGEREATSKNITPVTGAITSKLKQDWGLNDKWNELIAPRFERLNKLITKEGEPLSTDFGYWDKKINAFRTKVPDEIAKGFNKKRIDHRHHALDALVIACCSKRHTNYLNALNAEKKNYGLRDSLLIKSKEGHYTKHFLMPWGSFTIEAKAQLEKTIISFKQNLRVINKTNNKTWQWVEKNGKLKKQLVKQTKGDNWAIRKPMHKETVSGRISFDAPKGKIATATRVLLSDVKSNNILEKITDTGIKMILKNHLKNFVDEKGDRQFDLAFNVDGIEALNKNIVHLNNGKLHQPIHKVRLYEIGSKFAVGYKGNRKDKYVEAAKGTNLFFAIYWNEAKNKREYETIPLNEVIEHQKQVAHLPREERTPVPLNTEKGKFLFTLSPNDLVYVPTDEEMDNPKAVDFGNLSREQVKRILVVNDFSGVTCNFTPNQLSQAIAPKEVDLSFDSKKNKLVGSHDTKTTKFEGRSIKDCCWKLKVDRLGNVTRIKIT